MEIVNIPTSKDIYIEINGKKLALVQSYRVKAVKEAKSIEQFGSANPIGVSDGKLTYNIELSKIYVYSDALADGIDLYSLQEFNLVIVKPDKKIVYDSCNWINITETADVSKNIYENIVLTASKRFEITV